MRRSAITGGRPDIQKISAAKTTKAGKKRVRKITEDTRSNKTNAGKSCVRGIPKYAYSSERSDREVTVCLDFIHGE
jgi:hypothetical protein